MNSRIACRGNINAVPETLEGVQRRKGSSGTQRVVAKLTSGDRVVDVTSRRVALLGFATALTVSALQVRAEDVYPMDVEMRPEARPLKIRTERSVAIRDDNDRVVANGVLWDDQGTIVSSYITFKDMLRKNIRLTAEVGSVNNPASLGSLTMLGFDPTLDIVVFRSEKTAEKHGSGSMLKVVTGNYTVGQSVLGVVRNREGAFVTTGIVSGTDRVIVMANGVKNKGLLQTDCPISLESAGAGLWTEDGKLLGIFTPGNIPYASFRSDSGVNFVQTGATLVERVPKLMG